MLENRYEQEIVKLNNRLKNAENLLNVYKSNMHRNLSFWERLKGRVTIKGINKKEL